MWCFSFRRSNSASNIGKSSTLCFGKLFIIYNNLF
jgi:hypothetical protein